MVQSRQIQRETHLSKRNNPAYACIKTYGIVLYVWDCDDWFDLQSDCNEIQDPESHYVCDPDELLETMNAHGIGRAILMSSGETPDNGVHGLGAANTDCEAICSAVGGRLAWMCNFDPVCPETLRERMADLKSRGAVGVGEVMINQWMNSEFLEALFASAEELDLPVICHMSPEPGVSYGVCDRAGFPLLEQMLRRHPNLKYIGHSQVFWMEISADCPQSGAAARNGYGHGPVKAGGTLQRLFALCPNLYGDLSAYSAFCAITRDTEYGISFLERFQDRLMFATDMTNRRNVPPLERFLDNAAEEGKLSAAAYEKICRGNAQKLFGLICE